MPVYFIQKHIYISYVHTHINIIYTSYMHTSYKYTCACTYHINTYERLLKFKMSPSFKHKCMSLFAFMPHVYGCLQSPEEASDPVDLDWQAVMSYQMKETGAEPTSSGRADSS